MSNSTTITSHGLPTASLHSSLTRPRTLAALLLTLLLGLCTASIGAILPKLQDYFQESTEVVSLSITIYNLGALLAILTCGMMARTVSPKRIMKLSVFLFSVGMLFMGSATDITLFLAATSLAGAGYGSLVLHLNSAFAQGFFRHDVLMTNLLNSVFGAGAVIGPLLVGHLSVASALMCFLLSGVLAALTLPAAGVADAIKIDPEVRLPFRRQEIILLAPFIAIAFLYAGLETGTAALEATYLTAVGYSADRAAMGTALFWTGLTVGRIVIPIAAQRVGPGRLLACMSLCVALAVSAAIAPSSALLAFTVAGFAMGPVFPTTLAWLARGHPAAHFGNSALLVASMTGSTALPALITLAGRTTSAHVIPVAISALGLIMFLFVLMNLRRVASRA